MATAQALMTIEEYAKRPDPGYPEELVRGRIIALPMPKPRHGQVCSRGVRILGNFADEHDLGHVFSKDSGVITERDPDTLRGADISFYSYARVPKGPLPAGYLEFPPELVIEVRSPDDRQGQLIARVAEYLGADVPVVVILDPGPRSAFVYRDDQPPIVLGPDDELTIPKVLGPDFRVVVRRFFE